MPTSSALICTSENLQKKITDRDKNKAKEKNTLTYRLDGEKGKNKMAKITKEQYMQWNEQAKNGFNFDLRHYVIWSEKTLSKRIERAGGDVIEFKIEYFKEFEQKANNYGCKWNVETGRYIPTLTVTIWHPTGTGCYISGGYKERRSLGEPEKTKKYNILCKFSKEIDTDEYIKNMAV